jgi:hypothetical protein
MPNPGCPRSYCHTSMADADMAPYRYGCAGLRSGGMRRITPEGDIPHTIGANIRMAIPVWASLAGHGMRGITHEGDGLHTPQAQGEHTRMATPVCPFAYGNMRVPIPVCKRDALVAQPHVRGDIGAWPLHAQTGHNPRMPIPVWQYAYHKRGHNPTHRDAHTRMGIHPHSGAPD